MPRIPIWPPRVYPHKPSGRERIRVNGDDIWLGPIGSPEAKAEYARVVGELASRGRADPARKGTDAWIAVADVIALWLDHVSRTYSARGREAERFVEACRVLDRGQGRTAAALFGVAELRKVQEAMLSGSWMTAEERALREKRYRLKPGQGWCAPVTNRHINRLRTMWRWAETEAKIVPPGSWAGLCALKPVQANHPLYRPGPSEIAPRTVTEADVEAVCRKLPPSVAASLWVEWWTGMRPGELRIMRKGDVDRSGEVWVYRPRQHKNDWRGPRHVRVIMLGQRAQLYLSPWLDACEGGDDYVFPPSPCGKKAVPIDCYNRSRCYSDTTYAQAIRRAGDRAGIPHLHAYLCRHATRMRVSREQGDEAARGVLGQKNLATALDYGELDLNLAREVQRKIG